MARRNTPLVVDTSVVSILFTPEKRPVEQVVYYSNIINKYQLFISFQTVEELLFWSYIYNWGYKRKNELIDHIKRLNIVESDQNLAKKSAALRFECRQIGHQLNTADAWIAATALYLDCPLVTDDKDFEGVPDLEVIRYNP